MSRARRKRVSSPARTIGWSSARTRSIAMGHSEPGKRQRDLERGATLTGVDGQPPRQRIDSLAQDGRAPTLGVEGVVLVAATEGEAGAVVTDDVVDLVGQGIRELGLAAIDPFELDADAPLQLHPLDE